MPKTKSHLISIAAASIGLALAAFLVWLLLTQENTTRDFLPESSVETRESAPDFTLKLIDGGTFKFSNYKGKPMLINFLASWCLPCKEEVPAIEKITHEYSSKGVVFLGIGVDDTEEKMGKLIKKFNVTFPVGLDKTTDIQNAFGIYGIPTTYFIGRDGIINYFHSGVVTEELMRHELDKLL
jgi:peroxiredoxin